MKHLTDEREPITTEDIDQAIDDGWEYLNNSDGAGPDNLINRLLAIVEHAYGRPGRDRD